MRNAQLCLLNLCATTMVAWICCVQAASDYELLIGERSEKFDNLVDDLSSPHNSQYGQAIQTIAAAGDVELLESISKNAPNTEMRLMALQELRELLEREDFIIIVKSVMRDSVNKGRYNGETLRGTQKIFNFGLNTLNELLGTNYQEVRLLSRHGDLALARDIAQSFSGPEESGNQSIKSDIRDISDGGKSEDSYGGLLPREIGDSKTLGGNKGSAIFRVGIVSLYIIAAIALVGIVVVLMRSRKGNSDR